MAALTRSSAFIPSSAAVFSEGIAGGTIAEGDPVYIDTANSYVLKQADANASLLAATVAGLAEHAATIGQRLRYVTSDPACVIGATLVIGDTLWSSATAGGITKTAADNTTGIYTCVLGVAVSTTAARIGILNSGAVTP